MNRDGKELSVSCFARLNGDMMYIFSVHVIVSAISSVYSRKQRTDFFKIPPPQGNKKSKQYCRKYAPTIELVLIVEAFVPLFQGLFGGLPVLASLFLFLEALLQDLGGRLCRRAIPVYLPAYTIETKYCCFYLSLACIFFADCLLTSWPP